MGRPQDRSGSPTKGDRAHRGESSRLQTQAPLHHQPTTINDPSGEPVLGGKPSRSTRFTTNHQPSTN
ncbi:MAG: hypothetical protein ACHBN1_14015 [Heteroscytonema crispum UTEX LB 1556]